MKTRLVGKPVIMPVYNDNQDMANFVKKRGTFIGRFRAGEGKLLDYYALNFGDRK
jgi:hypothetical protein